MNSIQPNPCRNSTRHLSDLTDSELEANLHLQVNAERAATTAVLHHLREVERRRLHVRRGFSSLFEYCTRKLGYSESQAQRRISSARLLAELPEIESKITEGTLNLMHLSQAQSFFRTEAKTASAYTPEKKREVLARLEKQPARATEKILVSLATIALPAKESIKPMAAGQTELRIVVSEQTMQELERLKQILSHKMPGASLGQLIAEAVKTAVQQLDPMLKAQRRKQRRDQKHMVPEELKTRTLSHASEARAETKTIAHVHKLNAPNVAPANAAKITTASAQPADAAVITSRPGREPAPQQRSVYSTPQVTATTKPKNSRYISAHTKDAVRARDQGRCGYTDPQTGRRCESRHQLEFDHIKPHALGGTTDARNLRLRCRSHNEKYLRHFQTLN